jgi:predicted acetyltransferase
MANAGSYLRAPTEPALRALGDISAPCFGVARTEWDDYVRMVGSERHRVLLDGERVVAGLALYRAGQWFGGRSVPFAGFAAVAVAAEARGQGHAAALCAEVLRDLAAEGAPLAGLYASTLALYRKVGFELAGYCTRWRAPVADLPRFERDLPVRRVDPAATELLAPLARARALRGAGLLDRDEVLWGRVVRRRSEDVHVVLVGPEEAPEGYAVYCHVGFPHYDLVVRDQVALTPRAARRLLTFFADHRSMARNLDWPGPLHEPLHLLLREQRAEARDVERWLLRLCDVPGALSARGYPTDVEAELHLEVRDAVIPANQDRFVLTVSGGRGEVRRGGRGELGMEVRDLAPLYSGFHRAAELEAMGKLVGPPEALAAAGRIFSGPEPWMPDRF